MSDGKPGRGSDQFPLRLPHGMRDRLKTLADSNGRSMNAEIIARLEQSIEREEAWVNALENIEDLLMRVATLERELEDVRYSVGSRDYPGNK